MPDGCGGCVLFYMDQVTLISRNERGLNTKARRDVARVLVNDTRALVLWKERHARLFERRGRSVHELLEHAGRSTPMDRSRH
jgi:hypothetical protein